MSNISAVSSPQTTPVVSNSQPSSAPQIIIIRQETVQRESTISGVIRSVMVPVTTLACAVGFIAPLMGGQGVLSAGATALICGVIMSLGTLALQKTADALVDGTIYAIKVPFRLASYLISSNPPLIEPAQTTDDIAQAILTNQSKNK